MREGADAKFPSTVGILTLNSGKTLRRALDSVKDFAEIIVCDGNSTDDTLEIAREYGAKIVKQYDSAEPNLRCEKDKANVRNRNMQTASYDWYFFMDSDDELKPEVADEIRSIVENPRPPFFIYKMPSRIWMEGQLIKHASVYPAYQIRFFNRKTGASFKGPVHDHVVFDSKKYKVGVMKTFYDFHWPQERIRNFWAYQKKYTRWELETARFDSPASFLYWGIYRRLRIIAGFLFWRIPRLFLLHGFRDSMPPRFEFLVLLQQCYLLGLFVANAPRFLAGAQNKV
ncbi:glycosyltransferase family 2 protein [Candidatus Giovannonibacteria bacterium]|nr:glycosyltransferase family 2 protein [Candidatus Giovannonibacteria bacterium]